MRYTFETVKAYIQNQGYNLLSPDFTSSQIKLQITCPKGHIIQPTFSEFKRKARCNECSRSRKPTLIEIANFLNSKGFKLLSTEYKNNSSKLSVECSKGHVWQVHWNNLKSGSGCPDCYGNRKYTISQIEETLQEFNYKLNQDFYQDVSTKIKLICPKNHNYSIRYHDFLDGVRCSSCTHQTSNAEQEILSFIKQYYPSANKVRFGDIIESCSLNYSRKELDIYVPELKLAIEYCGLYWHSEASGEKASNQHRNKLLWCRMNNIRLLTIFEDEWLTRKDQVKNLFLSILGVHTLKVGARECEIKEITTSEAKSFVDSYHIQSLYTCSIAFGLFYRNELVGVITGNIHHRQNQNSFVLQRLCFKTGYQISGGASKLLSEFKKYAKNRGYGELISWSDNRISEGNVYEKIGFLLSTEHKPDYSYVKDGCYSKRHSKQSLKKTPEERLTGKTEVELRKEQDYYRIWDCGKKSWLLTL